MFLLAANTAISLYLFTTLLSVTYKLVSTEFIEKFGISTFEVCEVSKNGELIYSKDIFKLLRNLLLEIKKKV